MDNQQQSKIVNFIWGIADDCLRDVYVRGKYRDVILPMFVIRRLDTMLEKSKDKVIAMKNRLDSGKVVNQEKALCAAAGQAFYNTSPFKLKDLTSRNSPERLQADFEAYLNGFSDNVKEILSKFKFTNQLETMTDADILGAVIEKFVSTEINLSPEPVLDEKGNVLLAGLDNHGMGTVFEELIRRFNEENNEEAGEHFTPRDVVELMADLIVVPVADKLPSSTYDIYDGACGTGGMLTVAASRLQKFADDTGKNFKIHLYGQEINPETYAITKADMLIKGDGAEAANIGFGSTLSKDAHDGKCFDFMLSNPPYGKSWKTDKDTISDSKGKIEDQRFVKLDFGNTDGEGFQMIPRSSDGQMLFLLNNVAKMSNNERGSRIAEVHNGSSLFTGDAGQGESNARRYLVENDLVEAIIALPENMFYNTGIGTFVWVLSNRKSDERKGKIQLIDATNIKTPLRKNLGNKNCEFSQEQRQYILDMFLNFEENEYSKIFPNEEFGYYSINILRPLRLKVIYTDEKLATFGREYPKSMDLQPVLEAVVNSIDKGESFSYGAFLEALKTAAKKMSVKLTATKIKDIRNHFTEVCPEAEPVVAKVTKDKTVIYEHDTALTDTERVPLLYEGGIEAFFNSEVKPYADDAWIDWDSEQIGYEFSFTKYFYKPVELRSLEEIMADFKALEESTAGLLDEIMGD